MINHTSATANQGSQSRYEPPALTVHGTVAQVTKALLAGLKTDAAFPAGTPLQNLTFSL